MDNVCVRWVLLVARPSRSQLEESRTHLSSTNLSRVYAIKSLRPLEVDMLSTGPACPSIVKLVIDTSDVQMIDYFMHDHWHRTLVSIDGLVLNWNA